MRLLKKIQKIRSKILLYRNIKYLRFPTLTRPLLAARILPIKIPDNNYPFPDSIIERICCAFILADQTAGAEDIWTELTENNRPLIEALRAKNISVLRDMFLNLFHGSLLFGLGHTDIFISKKCPYDRHFLSLRCQDAVLSLAEALAVKNISSNQQTSLDDYIKSNNDNLERYIEHIERTLGHSISAPPVGRPPAVAIGRHIISPDSVRHAYVPHRLKQLGFKRGDAILEIGGGFGNVARYAYMQGLRDYTIIDLPHINSLQAAFLAATIGDNNLSLFGEGTDAPIKIFPASHTGAIKRKFQLTLNMDSMPEINTEEVLDYMDLIKKSSDYFLSINQEAKKRHKEKFLQNSVPEMTKAIGGFHLLHRHPYWMEQGYAEELYKLKP